MSGNLSLVSSIIPVHNGAPYLAAAIASARQQTHPALEIIVVDDGSTDESAALVTRDPAVRLLRQPQRGPAAARNSGLDAARGEFIAFLDADDLWPPDKLAIQIAHLRDNPALDVVVGHSQPFGADEPAAPLLSPQLGSALFRRSVFARVGPFDASLRYSEDHDWFLRAREQGIGLLVIPQVTLLHRRHRASMTAAPGADYDLPRVLKASLNRRRAANRPGQLPRLADFTAPEPS